MYRLKIVTHVYMKLGVTDNLVLNLYHSGIYAPLGQGEKFNKHHGQLFDHLR